MGIGTVAIHEVELGGLMALIAVIVTGVCDEFAVRRGFGRVVGTFPRCKGAKRAVRHTEFIDFGIKIFVIRFGVAIDGNEEIFAVGSPSSAVGAKFIATVWKIAVGDLARSAAFAVHDEDLTETGFEVAGAIKTVDETIIRGGRIGPFCSGGRSG